MRTLVAFLFVFLTGGATAQAELTLFAQYDWQNGATDVSGSPIRHDGVLDTGASIVDGKLVTNDWDGVDLGYMPELDGATDVLLRFEDVTVAELPTSGTTGRYSVFAGAGYNGWWVLASISPRFHLGFAIGAIIIWLAFSTAGSSVLAVTVGVLREGITISREKDKE